MTVLAIRAVREKMYIGIRESEARRLIETALSSAGLQNPGALTLFGGGNTVIKALVICSFDALGLLMQRTPPSRMEAAQIVCLENTTLP